ncbi:M20/M25/M40 family metallo-hydrolase [Bacillus sp. P14.5]|uniref:M20/M25/M40 family metallo-hydrolase n=1 Tax=Bacillus sp. P14.5 TaxID=1983400 RepID=UPI0031F5C19B
MKEYIQYKQDEMLKLIEELVNIDSGSVNKAGVDLVGSRLKAEYEKIGFMIHEVPQEEYGNHLFIQHKEADEPEILVIAHMDTVFPFGTAIERPFRRNGNKAYGPGVIDMKSSLVTLLFAMKALIKEGSPHYKNVQIILNSDEEIGSPSSKELIIDAAGGKNTHSSWSRREKMVHLCLQGEAKEIIPSMSSGERHTLVLSLRKEEVRLKSLPIRSSRCMS